ncbi:phage tail length tape measure family protein [Hydrogenophaga atypica]|uniref:Phage tail length tape measure family protein n=1 Tax=Hydrogenophaga atypica TaxID=249409 RepID=A0ABW2QGY6_9BURK
MSTREEKIQLATEVDSSGALQGLKRIEDGAAGMARAVSDSASKAGAGIDAMGTSGAQASAKIDANTRSIVASIQRATAAAEAGEKGTAKFFESLGRQRGADVGALQPYLQQLEQARQRTDSLTISTGQYTNALRMVPAQMTDIVTSLASGQDPLLVLIQQGGQLKDQFGGVGAAAKALGGYVMGMVNPLTLALAAAAGLALAFESGRKESALLDITATKTATTLGVTAGQLESIVSKLSGAGFSRGAISTALTEIAANGRVAADSLERYTLFAAELEKYPGQGVAETAKVFKELADEPTKATLKLNEALGYLTQSQYEQIKALEEQGRKTEAARIAQAAYADAVKPTIEAYKANMGALETAMDFWARKGKSMWDAITGIGRSDTGEERIAAAREKLESMRTRGGAFGQSAADRKAMIQAAQDELNYLERVTQAVRDNAAAEAKRQATQRAGIEASGAVEAAQSKGLGKQYQLNKALDDYREGLDKIRAANPESALLNPERVAAGEKAIREQFKDTAIARVNAENMQIAALRSRAVAEEEALRRLQVYGLQADKLTDGEREVLRLQEQIAVATDGRAKSVLQAELAEARRVATAQRAQVVLRESLQLERDLVAQGDKQLAGINNDAEAILRRAIALEAENEVWGKSRAVIEAAALARMQSNAADIAGFKNSEQVVAAINNKTDAQQRYVDALKAAELKTFNQRGDEMLRQAQELRDTYADELRMVGLSAVEREKIVAVRQVELKYAKLIADVERSSLSDAEKRAQVGKLVEAKGIESSAVVNRVLQQDFARTSAQIEQTLTDALMRGFESGKDFAEVLRDTVVNMFKTMVLRPVIQAVVQGGMGAMGMGGSQDGSGGMFNNVSNGYSLMNNASGAGAAYTGFMNGMTVAAEGGSYAGMVANPGLYSQWELIGGAYANGGAGTWMGTTAGGVGLSAAGGLSAYGFGKEYGAVGGFIGGAGTVAAAGAVSGAVAGTGATAGATAALGSVPVWGWIAIAALAILGSLDDSGTLHAGGAGSYSKAQGSKSGLGVDGLDFALDVHNEGVSKGAAALSQSLVEVLDTTAKTFGKDAGYWAATGFADDSSGDGAWGALNIMRDGQSLIDWKQGADKWPGREFADGEKGYTEYLNAISKDVRDVLIESTPDWADAMLKGLGDSVTMDGLSMVVTQINQIQAALEGMGAAMPQLASLTDEATSALISMFGSMEGLAAASASYYENFYSDAERASFATAQVAEAMGELGLSMPATRDAFRALVEAQDLSTESGRKNYAALLQLAPAFASVTEAVTQTASGITTAATQARDAAFKQLQASVDAEKALWQRQADGASALRDEVAAVFDILSEGVNSLRAEALGPVAAAARGQDTIQQALASARAGLGLPDAEALANAIDSARGGMGMENYASLAEQQFAQLKLAGDLEDLSRFAGDQLNEAERQLLVAQQQMEALDQTLVYWRDMLTRADAGTEVNRAGYVSVVDAIAELQEAIKPGSTGRRPNAGTQSAPMYANAYGEGSGYTTDPYSMTATQEQIYGGLLAYNAENRTAYEQAQVYLNAVRGGELGLGGADAVAAAMAGAGASQAQIDATAAAAAAYQQFQQDTGRTPQSATEFLSYYGQEDPYAWMNLPRFADGGWHSGGWAMVGERGPELAYMPPAQIYTATQTQSMLGGNTQRLEALVESLTAEVQRLQVVVNDGNTYQRRTAETLDNVTEGGAGMRTFAA